MKKASLIFVLASLILFGCAYYFMQKSAGLISKNDQEVLEIETSLNDNRSNLPDKLVPPDDKVEYYFMDLDLKQADHIIINNCLQFYNNDNSFENANRCEELIVDAVVKNMGEIDFIKAILGNSISYEKDVSLKGDFISSLFNTPTFQSSLKSKLIVTFLNRYRDPLKLETMFDRYQNFFLNDISNNIFSKLFENQVDVLINSFDEIQEQDDIEAFYQQIYYEAETKNRHAEFWNFTFWKRRELEKNDQIIYAILKEIKTHYDH